MNPMVMMHPPRLTDGPDQDPAAMLLRSARADAPPSGAKDRVRAMLGFDSKADGAREPTSPMPARPKQRMRSERKKQNHGITRFVPFQQMLAEPKRLPVRRFVPIATAVLQVAAIVAALFVRPYPRVEPAPEKAVARRDEPEVSFFVPKAKKQEATAATASLPESNAKPLLARKESLGKAAPLRAAPVADSGLKNESIVADEHAGMLVESVATNGGSAVEMAPSMLRVSSTPIMFQAGMAQPERIYGIDPSYPKIARMRGVTGTVIMRCVITEKGFAENCTILKSPAYLDEAVLSAARSWRFTPMKWQGRTVSVNYVFKYLFKLG